MMSRERLGILRNFFQMLTQAVGKVERVAMVASLISADILSNDPTGVQVLDAMEGVFRRMEETVEPVSREDISELLRRRLFEEVPDEWCASYHCRPPRRGDAKATP